MNVIITHPGSAHQDDLLAVALLIATQPTVDTVLRREPTQEELDNRDIYVVDVGGRHQPELHNFDHHQFDGVTMDNAECALTLVLRHLQVLDTAREIFPWLRTAEQMDCCGPKAVADSLGLTLDQMAGLRSPIGAAIIRLFSGTEVLSHEDPLFDLLRQIGHSLWDTIQRSQARLAYLQEKAEMVALVTPGGEAVMAADMRCTKDLCDPLLAVERFCRAHPQPPVATISYAARGEEGTVTLFRRLGCEAVLDFNKIADHPSVAFCHKNGFLASLKPGTDPLPLLQAALT